MKHNNINTMDALPVQWDYCTLDKDITLAGCMQCIHGLGNGYDSCQSDCQHYKSNS